MLARTKQKGTEWKDVEIDDIRKSVSQRVHEQVAMIVCPTGLK